MKPKELLPWISIFAVLTALPALAADPDGSSLGVQAADFRNLVGEELTQCAEEMGVTVAGEPSIITNDETSAALLPVANIENITRDDLATGVVVAVFTASGPANAEAPSGTFQVFVQAPACSTHGVAQIIDGAGNVVQSWEITVDVDPDATPPTVEGSPVPVKGGVLGELGPVAQVPGSQPQEWHYTYPGCPWYYPYFGPYYFHYYPAYKYGCHYWYYRWWWGKLYFHYCWWPSRYCHRCCCW